MTALLDQECRLSRTADGRFERTLGRVWWGEGAQHGGYVMALAMTAVSAAIDDPLLELQHCTVHYMRPFLDGPFVAEVDVVRRGRTMANVTARMGTQGKDCGLLLASVGLRRAVGEFCVATMPDVAPYDSGEAPWIPWMHVPTFDRVHMYRRFLEASDPGRLRVGGWVVPRTPEIVDHRYLAFLADLWVPCAYHVWDPRLTGQSVDITYHARSVLPRSDLPPGTPLLVVLDTRASAGGFVDEDTEIWTPAGELLATTRQMRYVHPPA
ncbi:MAG: thioesterase family protein [Acidimicrobiales bacterium]|nr:thioesterase family protein [Acidimicrobiales bacterium]